MTTQMSIDSDLVNEINNAIAGINEKGKGVSKIRLSRRLTNIENSCTGTLMGYPLEIDDGGPFFRFSVISDSQPEPDSGEDDEQVRTSLEAETGSQGDESQDSQ